MLTVTGLIGVMLGGAVGGMLRLWVGNTVARRVGTRFPWGTLAVNLTATLLLGLAFGAGQGLAASFEGLGWGIIAAGLLGGYSTVSSLSLQTLTLWQQKKRQAAAYLFTSVAGGIALVALGSVISHGLMRALG
ncbi:fluoride efflux transporter FluC [Vreelandella massiliensis]|uniref:fluoride efflux transporter FluC n=1 Tax=Vreelandella massiliensis TaxID=1816686 RepID=UPI00096ACB62|nr:CrcB family protein [Halomonas massiliensis]MYL23592.1 camphor resistance protein CrcB [Halomonas alkaliantarctica]